MGTARKISLTVLSSIKLVWSRLPFIALYSGCLAVLWLVGTFAYSEVDKQFVQAAPVENYLKYTAFTVNNIREGEDLTYTVCRDFKGPYTSTGKRTVYIIPQGKTTKDRALLYNKEYSGTVEGDACQSYVVRDSTYHLTPGKYQLTLSGDIPVQYGILKHYFVESQVFTVYPQPVGSTDYQAQINNLTQEIEELKRRIGVSVSEAVEVSPASPQPVETSGLAPTPSPSPSLTPTETPTPTPRPCAIGLLGLCILGAR